MSDDLFSRDEVLGGLPAKRANTITFLIETCTARQVMLRQQIAEQFTDVDGLPGDPEVGEDFSYLNAFVSSKDLPVRPTIQDIERYAEQWGYLIPDRNPRLRAAIAHTLGLKYRFTADTVPQLRSVIGCDEADVQTAYERLYNAPLASIYAPQMGVSDRLRWSFAALGRWIEGLPPFWLACWFTVAANFSQSILALPVAVASVGPLVALVIVAVIGLVNTVALGLMAESVVRTGSMRYGTAFLGRLVRDYLGGTAAWVVTASVAAIAALGLLAATLGLSVTMAKLTHWIPQFWATVLLSIVVYRLWREGRRFGVTSMIVLGTAGILGFLGMAGLALGHLQPAFLNPTLTHPEGMVNWLGVAGTAAIAPVLGGVFGNFMSSTRVPHCGKVVLPQDTSGRSVIWGSMAGTLISIVLMAVWIVAVNGAVDPDVLAQTMGTAIDPLVEVTGPALRILGIPVVCLTLGLAAIRVSDLLFNLVRERLPKPPLVTAVRHWWARGDRQAATLARHLGQDPALVQAVLDHSAPPTPAPRSLRSQVKGWLATGLVHPISRFALCVIPVVAVYALTLVLLQQESISFSAVIAAIGVLANPLVAGVFPVLLFLASRQRGDRIPAGALPKFLSNGWVLALVYGVFLGNLLLHGLWIWSAWPQRLAALGVAIVAVGITITTYRQGAFRSQAVIEVREEQHPQRQGAVTVMAQGQPLVATIRFGKQTSEASYVPLTSLGASTQLRVTLPDHCAQDLKVWVHRVTPDGLSEGVATILDVITPDQTRHLVIPAHQAMVSLSLPPGPVTVTFSWAKPRSRGRQVSALL